MINGDIFLSSDKLCQAWTQPMKIKEYWKYVTLDKIRKNFIVISPMKSLRLLYQTTANQICYLWLYKYYCLTIKIGLPITNSATECIDILDRIKIIADNEDKI